MLNGCDGSVVGIRFRLESFEQVDVDSAVLIGSGSMSICRLLRLMIASQLLLNSLREMEQLQRLKGRLQADTDIAKRMFRRKPPCRRIEISRARDYASGLLVEEFDCRRERAFSFT